MKFNLAIIIKSTGVIIILLGILLSVYALLFLKASPVNAFALGEASQLYSISGRAACSVILLICSLFSGFALIGTGEIIALMHSLHVSLLPATRQNRRYQSQQTAGNVSKA